MKGRKGEAIQIVTVKEDRSLGLNEAALKKILLQDKVADKPVVIVSVAGAFRKGKSFLLNLFIRFLESKVKNKYRIFIL
jgi:atlastin